MSSEPSAPSSPEQITTTPPASFAPSPSPQPDEPRRGLERFTPYLLGGGAALLVLLLFLSLWGPGGGTNKDDPRKREDRGLEAARQALARETDLNACQNARLQLNTYLSQDPQRRPPAMPLAQRERVQKFFKLEPAELEELDAGAFTTLDAHYLEECFLFRDAARGLDVQGASDANNQPLRATPLERTVAAFNWVIRQTRLQLPESFVAPPSYAARRGWTSDLERALIFLALVRQLDRPDARMIGCLLFVPDKASLTPRLWACGVAIDGSLYLFDPRLGLPLPGPGGRGVATLAQVVKDDAVLRQLDGGEKLPYDITAELAARAEVQFVCPLSALPTRMVLLQVKLAGPASGANFAVAALEDLEKLQTLTRGPDGKELEVVAWRESKALNGPGLLRRFLPPEEGGADAGGGRRRQFAFELVPWRAYPIRRLDPNRFPENLPLGQRVRDYFARSFLDVFLSPQKPRDLILRGRLDQQAWRELSQEQDNIEKQESASRNQAELDRELNEWATRAREAYTVLLRLQQEKADPQQVQQAAREVEALWLKAEPLVQVLQDAMALPRGGEWLLLLALCTHERAERTQARIDLLLHRRDAAVRPEDWQKAEKAWRVAAYWWGRYQERYTDGGAYGNLFRDERDEKGGTVATRSYAYAARMRGRSHALLAEALQALEQEKVENWATPQLVLGGLGRAALKAEDEQITQERQQATAAWSDLGTPLTPLEQVGGAYLARQLEQRP
jgi:hypothetical protein